MILDFRSLTETLAKFLIAKPDFKDFLLSIGVDVADWPDSKAKRIAETYLALREKENHEYALHVVADDARYLKSNEAVPLEPGALKVIYAQHRKVYRAKRLADELALAEVDQYDALISEYQQDQVKGIQVFNFIEQIKPLIQATESAAKEGRAVVAIPKWERLSTMIGGFNPGRVSLLVADTGFGKTNLSANLARDASKVGPVLFVNMEMMPEDFGDKLLMGVTRTDFSTYKSGNLDLRKASFAVDELRNRKLFYTDGRALSIDQIYAVARQTKTKHGLFILFIDYDQKIKLRTSRDLPEWKALQIAVEQLEELAKYLEIYVLLMAQSNDEGNPSGSKRSKQPASTVLRFYRNDGKTIVQAIKNRFGRHNAAIEVKYEAERALVYEVDYARTDAFEKDGRLK